MREAVGVERAVGGRRAVAPARAAAAAGRARPRLSDRAVLNGILYVLRTGTAWELLPAEVGWGSGMTCWRRLRDWQVAGVWARLHRVLLERLAGANQQPEHDAARRARALLPTAGRLWCLISPYAAEARALG